MNVVVAVGVMLADTRVPIATPRLTDVSAWNTTVVVPVYVVILAYPSAVFCSFLKERVTGMPSNGNKNLAEKMSPATPGAITFWNAYPLAVLVNV
jgi:hypothetical protein